MPAVPSIDREPPFQQVAEHYRAQIRSGALLPGDEMPAVRRIAAVWDVAAGTAARALTALREEGWVVSRPGKPAIVAPDHPR